MQQTGGQTLNGVIYFKWGAGHHWPPVGDGPDVSQYARCAS